MTDAADPIVLPTRRRPRRDQAAAAVTVVSTAVAQAPEIAAYGLIALAPLGTAFGPQAMALALLGTAAANALACLVGAGRLVTGPKASLSLLTAGLAAGLMAADPAGRIEPLHLLVLLAIGLAAAGALQVAFGLLGLGRIVKFTPHPVRAGLVGGVGLLLVATALPVMFGLPFGAGLLDLASSGGPSAAACVGTAALASMALAVRLRSPVPPVLVGLVGAAALHAVLASTGWATSIGPRVGVPLLPWPGDGTTNWPGLATLIDLAVPARLGPFALTVAALCTLDTLLATSVVDGRLHERRDARAELVAQGSANIVASLTGGIAGAPSIPRTLALVEPLPDSRYSVLAYAAALLALLLLAPRLMGLLPSSAIGGVLVLQGLLMASPALLTMPWQLWLQRGKRGANAFDRRQRRLLAENWAVACAVALSTVVLGLPSAVLIGATLAVLLFVRSSMRDLVRRVRTGETRHSLKMRPPEIAARLHREGRRIAVLELEGPIFFGTADSLRARLDSLAASTDTAILDLHQVSEVDATGARILLETAEGWARAGRTLVAAEWGPGDPRRLTLEAMATPGRMPDLVLATEIDSALEQAEDRLLARLHLDADAGHELSLAETQLGQGLSAIELAALQALMERVSFPARTVLFRVGEPGDALYISVSGHIGLRLPGSNRRLASFAPGVSLGEMAVLGHLPRSAEAVAETDVVALRLPVAAFDRLKFERPALAAQLLHNIALHLAARVRALTTELSDWTTRTAAGQASRSATDRSRPRAAADGVD